MQYYLQEFNQIFVPTLTIVHLKGSMKILTVKESFGITYHLAKNQIGF